MENLSKYCKKHGQLLEQDIIKENDRRTNRLYLRCRKCKNERRICHSEKCHHQIIEMQQSDHRTRNFTDVVAMAMSEILKKNDSAWKKYE